MDHPLATVWPLMPAAIADPMRFLVLGSLAAILFSMAKSGFGGSIGILAMPMMILACGGQASLALGLLLPMLMAADYVAVVFWRRRWDGRAVLRVLPGVVLGIGAAWAGLYLLRRLDVRATAHMTDTALKIGVGLISIGFVALQGVRRLRGPVQARAPGRTAILLIGAAAGATSMIAHAAGPVIAMYTLSLGMPKGRYVASVALTFWTINHLKLPAYIHLGMINVETLGATVLLIPAIVIGAAAGILLHRRFAERSFTGVVYTLLAIAGAGLLYDGVRGILS